jgi:hypothetical protein|tara:strand:+ start:58173 stop:58532 length:360 start_codon:yes stop_codon:yes gene_type:complete
MKVVMLAALAGLTLLSAGPAGAQGIGHTWFMRGSIVGADESGPVVCIGKTDGADVGQVLEVYRNVRVPGARAYKGAGPSYRRRFVGRVRIDHVYDDHFARVTVTEGNPAKHDIVELRKN